MSDKPGHDNFTGKLSEGNDEQNGQLQTWPKQ
jgi:hypothetical protein